MLDDHSPRVPKALDDFIAAAVREAEASRIASTCHACGGGCIDDAAEPCDQCDGGGLEFESIIVEGQATG